MPSAPDFHLPIPKLLPTWLSRFYIDDDVEVQDNVEFQIHMMPTNVREMLCDMITDLLGQYRQDLGILSQATYILERYSAVLAKKADYVSRGEWQSMMRAYRNKILLLMGVSVMMASKIDQAEFFISISLLKKGLQKYGQHFSSKEIKCTEAQMYNIAGPRVAFWTNVQKVQTLVMELNLPPRTTRSVALCMQLIDIQLPIVYEQIQNEAEVMFFHANFPIVGDGRVRTIHLLAGVVLATFTFLDLPGSDIAVPLASLCRAPVLYLRWLGKVLRQYLERFMVQDLSEQHQEPPNDDLDDLERQCQVQ